MNLNFDFIVFPSTVQTPDTGDHFEFAEKWMMAGKARLFDDAATLVKIMRADSAAAFGS